MPSNLLTKNLELSDLLIYDLVETGHASLPAWWTSLLSTSGRVRLLHLLQRRNFFGSAVSILSSLGRRDTIVPMAQSGQMRFKHLELNYAIITKKFAKLLLCIDVWFIFLLFWDHNFIFFFLLILIIFIYSESLLNFNLNDLSLGIFLQKYFYLLPITFCMLLIYIE